MKRTDNTELILNGNISKALIVLAIPIIINNFIQTLYNLVDGIWVGKISSVHFAATSFVWPINFLFLSIGIGISIAGTSLLSQLIGSKQIDKAKEYANQLIVVSVITALTFSVLGIILSPYIIKLMGGTGEIARLGNIYLRITFLDMVFLFLFFNINSIMNAQGNTITPTILSAISALINVILDPIFIFTFNMGIAGAAWATLVSRVVLSLWGLKLLFSDTNKIRPNFKGFKFDGTILKRIVNVALPSSLGQAGAALGFVILNGFIVSYGTATMAAFGMVNRITSLIMQPANGIGAALTTIVGQNIGAEKIDRVQEGFNRAVKITLTAGTIGCIILLVFNKYIVNFFIQSKDDMEVIYQGINYLKYIAYSMPFLGLFSVFQGVFQGSGHTKYTLVLEVGRLWFIRLPMIVIFKTFTDIGSNGIWFSMSFSNFLICVFAYMIYRRDGWKRKVIDRVVPNVIG